MGLQAFLDPTGGGCARLSRQMRGQGRPRHIRRASCLHRESARLTYAKPGFVYNFSDDQGRRQIKGSPNSSLAISTASLQAASLRRS